MKKILNLITAVMLVLFMSACGSSGGGDTTTPTNPGNPGIEGDSGIPDADDNSVKSGTFTTTFDGASSKTWYTVKTEAKKYDSDEYVTINQAHYSRNGDAINIMIGARSQANLDTTDGSLAITFNFPSGVTTGDIDGSILLYKDNDNAESYTVMPGIIGNAYQVNIVKATDDGEVVNIKGSLSTVVLSPDRTVSKTLTVNFEFEAHPL